MRYTRAAVCLVAMVGVLAGCGSDGGSDPDGELAAGEPTTQGSDAENGSEAGSDGAEELAPVAATLLPIIDTAPIYLGVEQGFFEDVGIDLTIETAGQGSTAISGVVAGEYQFAYTGAINYMQARESGIPLQVLASAQSQTETAEQEQGNGALMVAPDSGIEEPADLEGGTVAVNALRGVLDLGARNSLEKAGVDISTVDFVEVPFANMIDAVLSGDVDASMVNEPFMTIGEQRGAVRLTEAFADFEHPWNASVYVTSQEQAEQNSELMASLQEAIAMSLSYAQDNQDEARAMIPQYAQLDAELSEQVALPYWHADVNMDSMREQAELSVRYGLLESMPDINEIFQASQE